jgi:RNA polymerase sigma-70 factor, ECF subfamily
VQRSIERMQAGVRYAAWVRRIARHVWIDHRRGARPQAELVDLADERDLPEFSAQVALWLEPSLAELKDPLTAEILRRTELAAERQAEVARDLGLSLGAVKARVRRGRTELRRVLEDCCAFEFDARGAVIDAQPRAQAGDCSC